jgi:hypothetical protein
MFPFQMRGNPPLFWIFWSVEADDPKAHEDKDALENEVRQDEASESSDVDDSTETAASALCGCAAGEAGMFSRACSKASRILISSCKHFGLQRL